MPTESRLLVAIPVAGRQVFVAVDLHVVRGPDGVTLKMPDHVTADLAHLAEALRIRRARRVGV